MALTPAALVERIHRYKRAAGRWPTEDELPAYLRCSAKEVSACIDSLVAEGQFHRRSGLVMPGEPLPPQPPKPVVPESVTTDPEPKPTRQYRPPVIWPDDYALVAMVEEHGAEEAAAMLGGSPSKIKRQAEAARRRLGRKEQRGSQEVQEEMPKGQRIAWPPDAELVARYEKLRGEVDSVVRHLAQEFGCSETAIGSRILNARRRIKVAIPTSGPTIPPTSLNVSQPTATGGSRQGVSSPEPEMPAKGSESSAEPMVLESLPEAAAETPHEAEQNQSGRLTEEQLLQVFSEEPEDVKRYQIGGADATPDPVGGADATPGYTVRSVSSSARWDPVTGRLVPVPPDLRGLIGEPAPDTMGTRSSSTVPTHATMILVDESLEFPAQGRHEYEQLTRAPEQVGEEWPELIRVNGLRQVRTWVCVYITELNGARSCVMLPKGAAVVQQAKAEKGAA